MDKTVSLLRWAAEEGVTVAGIRPETQLRSGHGMMATRDLEVLLQTLQLKVLRTDI